MKMRKCRLAKAMTEMLTYRIYYAYATIDNTGYPA